VSNALPVTHLSRINPQRGQQGRVVRPVSANGQQAVNTKAAGGG